MDDRERGDTLKEFEQAVNMTPHRLRQWLESDRSRSAGEDGQAVSERTVHVLETNAMDLTDADFEHMRQVVARVRHCLAERPPDGDDLTAWRRSLMSWGHDPLRR